ncbi:MAG: hypothetical protein IPN19_06855 [Elusimicrobia bacterium]|nr:hypothetical protein [Elusimicrobiota bacterium]
MKRTRGSNRAVRFRGEIDVALDTDGYVEWDDANDYVEKLSAVLEKINDAGNLSPSFALDAALYFVQEVPSVFNNVHDECELEMFCTDLAESAVTLAKKVGGETIRETAECLIKAYLADATDTCRFDAVLDVLAKGWRLKNDKRVVAEVAAAHAEAAEAREAAALRALAEKLWRPRR